MPLPGFLLVAAQDLRVHGVGLPVVAPALPRLSRLVEHGREGVLYDPEDRKVWTKPSSLRIHM